MSSLTVRNIDDDLKRSLRLRAAEKGRSMEEEVRIILRQAVLDDETTRSLAETIHARFAALGGVDLEIPPREAMREPPSFD